MKAGIFIVIILSMMSCGKKNSSSTDPNNSGQVETTQFLVTQFQNQALRDQTGDLSLELYNDGFYSIYNTQRMIELAYGNWNLEQRNIHLQNTGIAKISNCLEMLNETITGQLANYLYRRGFSTSSRLVFCPGN